MSCYCYITVDTWGEKRLYRYTIMVRNVLDNIPNDWVLQILHLDNEQFHSAMQLNRGLHHMIENNPRIILTPIPREIAATRKRPKYLMLHPWVWENMITDTVLLFGGNHVICGNSPFRVRGGMGNMIGCDTR